MEDAARARAQAEAAAAKRRGAAPPLMPLTAAECADVIAGLRSGGLDWYDVQQRIVAAVRGGRLWKTAEWQIVRARLIRDYCEQCEATEGPFVLQHFWHPSTVHEIISSLRLQLRERAWSDFEAERATSDGLQDIELPDGPPRHGCPKCGGYNLQERKRTRGPGQGMPRFRCCTVRNKRRCDHEFEVPIVVQPTRAISVATQRRAAFEEIFAREYRLVEHELFTTAAVHTVEEFARYMSGDGTATFCRRCAYLWDEEDLRLCLRCRDGWHALGETMCSACRTGRLYVLCSVCRQHRHSDRYPTCYTCRSPNGDAVRGSV